MAVWACICSSSAAGVAMVSAVCFVAALGHTPCFCCCDHCPIKVVCGSIKPRRTCICFSFKLADLASAHFPCMHEQRRLASPPQRKPGSAFVSQCDTAVTLTPACASAAEHDPMRAAVATAASPSTLLAGGAFCTHTALQTAGPCDLNAVLLLRQYDCCAC